MATTVFAFKGRAYYGKPGWEYRPLEVQEDFGPWRPATSQDGKQVAAWLVKHGFRLAYRKLGQGATACDYEEWWATLELIGAQGDCPPRELRKLLAGSSAAASDVRFEKAYGWHTIYWFVDREVEPNEWMERQHYAPQGYGPGKIYPVQGGTTLSDRRRAIPVPAWARFVVSHMDNCD